MIRFSTAIRLLMLSFGAYMLVISIIHVADMNWGEHKKIVLMPAQK